MPIRCEIVASWSLAIIRLSNIARSFAAGWMLNHFRGKYILFGMYGSRTLLILLYLAAPKTEWTFYLMAIGLGFSWLGTARRRPPAWSASFSARATWRRSMA